MDTITSLKTQGEDFEVEYAVVTPIVHSDAISELDERLAHNQAVLDQINIDIEKLTNHSDGFDYALAACSGVFCGFIDSFYVGEFNFVELKTDAHEHVNKFIEKYAELSGWKGKEKGGRLVDAIKYLEGKFPVDQDNIWKGKKYSSTRYHHIDDLAHHPTLCGLFFAIVVSFFECAPFVDKNGKWHLESFDTNPKNLAKLWIPILISGILRWLVYVAESKYLEKEGKKLPTPIRKLLKAIAYTPGVIAILQVAVNWFSHLVSDMGGSKNTPDGGMGIPGIFISLLKELSSLPWLNQTGLPEFVSDLYSKDRIDMRAELAILEYIGKQALPVIINECIVRCFYFVRHLIYERRKCGSWKDVPWENVFPWKNRTINRMLTIATGTFTTFDVADAAVRSVIKNGANVYNPKLYADFILRVNFVGLGRFAIAIGNDIYMGHNKRRLEKERLYLMSEQILLTDAKIFYKQADMWVSAKNATEAIDNMEEVAMNSVLYIKQNLLEISRCLTSIVSYRDDIERNNPNLLDDISKTLIYGK